MAYFTNFQGYLFLCSDIPFEERQKLDNYLQLLEDSGIGKIIEESLENILEMADDRLIIHIVYLLLFFMLSPNILVAYVVLKKV